jgi:hypothetical protein
MAAVGAAPLTLAILDPGDYSSAPASSDIERSAEIAKNLDSHVASDSSNKAITPSKV